MPDPLDPPRPELLALLDAVKDNPDDDTPRLVLADWLEENGDRFDAARARYIRRHIAEARGLQRPLVSDQARREEAELLRGWLEPFADFRTGWTFERGLPQINVPNLRLLEPDALAILASEAFAFVQFVRLVEDTEPGIEALAALPELRSVSGLGLHPYRSLGAQLAGQVFASPHFSGLRQLEVRSANPGTAGMQALAANTALSRLRKLNLAHNKLVDKAVAALAESPHLANLTYLSLADNNIGDKGAEALAASEAFPSLRELDLRDNPRITERGKQLLRDRFGDRVSL